MSEQDSAWDISAARKPAHSLRHSLLLWFLLLALLPLALGAWIGYRQAIDGLMNTAIQGLAQGSQLKANFIQNWFDNRVIDLNNQAENLRNAEFLAALEEALQTSKKSLPEFVKSDAWASLVNDQQQGLVTFARHYNYIYDLLLIDNDGNILFTTTHKSNLGSNLFKEPYANTRFAHSARASLATGQTLFSDLERYAPSNNQLASFLTAPILNKSGKTIGIFAIQLQLERINELILNHSSKTSLTHYLVGLDGLLRTPINNSDTNQILRQQIETAPFKHWKKTYQGQKQHLKHEAGAAFKYSNFDKQQVVGLHQTINLPGIDWVLISEIDQDEALATAHRLGQIILAVFLLTAALASMLAIYQARRITQPIIQLADASMAVAAGKLDQQVEITSNNEIGALSEAFNHMLMKRQIHEFALEQSNIQTHKALAELDAQKFALDQHAIVAITDVQGTITFVNDKFTEISGYSRNELLGQNHRILNSGHHNKQFFHEMFHTIGKGNVWHGEICNKAKDTHLYWVDTTIVPFMSKDGKPESYIAIRTDITERKQADCELRKAKEAAESATQQKSEFLANMSHEIRTPMNGIIGMTGLLLDTQLTAKQHNYAKTALDSADALLCIINDILDFSKIEAGKLELEEIPFDLQSLTEDVAELMALKCQEKGIEMLLRYTPNCERFVIGDPGRVRQILLNLLSNAIKFTEEGHILLTVESFRQQEEITSFRVTIKDTGIGIAKDRVDHIFNKFDQEDGSTTRKYGGTGLGLTICRQLCTLMQGNICVESEKGKGSTFSFTIQLGVDSKASPVYPHPDSYSHLKELKTLIVDDTEVAHTILKEQLSILQMQLTSARSGHAALATLKTAVATRDPFDIVITDSHMPEMDGEHLAKEISQQKLLPNGVMIFITSSPHKSSTSRLKRLGFSGYLTKPTHPSEVPQILALAWDAKQQGKEIPLVTRHTLQEARTGSHKKAIFPHTQILLAEDNPVNVMVATELLEGHGCTVTPAGNGLEAVALVKKRHFDLIFMDCQMPEMDGFEATTEIQKLQSDNATKRTPIIAFTANAMQSDKEQCLNAGMDDYISKPVSQDSLEKILIKWLPHKLKETKTEKTKTASQPTPSSSTDSNILELETFNTLKQLFGDRFTPAIEQHTQNAQKNVQQIEEALKQNDLKTAERAAHSLKGASMQFGAASLGSIAAEIEALARNKEPDSAKALLAKLKNTQQQAAHAMLQQLGIAAETAPPDSRQTLGRVLIVDDNLTNQEVACGMLVKRGLHTDIATNGQEAIKMLSASTYDLIFMDCQMPVMDGFDATRHIRNPQSPTKNSMTPIIAMTANTTKADRDQCLAVGMNDYISKPVNAQQLQQLLDKWLPASTALEPDKTTGEKEASTTQQATESMIFDAEAMSNRLMNDRSLMQAVAETFLDDMVNQIAQLKQAAQATDLTKATALAHKIKGASANIGGITFSKCAHEIEQAEDLTSIHKRLPTLEQHFAQLKATMKETLL